MSNRNSKIILLALFLVSVALRISRVLPNFEFVTTAVIISAAYLTRKQSMYLVLAIMAVTDLFLGNTNIFLFTWSGFLIPAVILPRLHKSNIISVLFLALGTNLFFYLWTNFGVWLLDSWDMYPKTFPGLISCYVNALPFLKTQLQSTLVFIPLTHLIINCLPFCLTALAKKPKLRYNT